MQEIIINLIDFFIELRNNNLPKELIVFFIGILPFFELRGALIASSVLGLNPFVGYLISLISSSIPVPLILVFINKVMIKLSKSKRKMQNKMYFRLEKLVSKNRKLIERYSYIGIILFIAIPFPGTGSYSASIIAGVLNLNKKKSFISILTGTILSSFLTLFILYGILDL